MEKTARILFVLGKYYPQAGANGVCVSRVQKVLLEKGIQSDVIAEGEHDDVFTNAYGTVYITDLQTSKQMNKLQNVRAALRYPIYFPDNIRRYAQTIEKALSEHHYNAIVAVLKPLEGAIAAMDYSNLMVYELDSISNNDDNEHGFRRFLRHRTHRYERELYEKACCIFHMESHKTFYGQRCYDRFQKKAQFLDIPQLVDEGIPDRANGDLANIKVVYSGILNKGMRSPEYSISLVKELNKQPEISLELNFYSRGNCESMLEAAQRETGGKIKQRGYVSLEELNAAVAETDVLLSIGNSLTGKVTSLPSKVISYMAYGKPILHIDGGANDVAKDYLAKYPLAIVIDPHADLQENVKKLRAFLMDAVGKRVCFKDLETILEKNTPQYTANQIVDKLETVCEGYVQKR